MAFDIEQQLRKDLQKLTGLCCWDAKNTEFSWLSLNFGDPRLDIREPKDSETLAQYTSARIKLNKSLRHVWLRGDFWVWIDCCHWDIVFRGKKIAHSESRKSVMAKSMGKIDGQIIKKIEIFPDTAQTNFIFDLGGEIQMRRYEDLEDRPLWHFYDDKAKNVYSFKDNGKIKFGPGNQVPPVPEYSINNLIIDL